MPPKKTELPQADIDLFFRVLRFLSEHSELANSDDETNSTDHSHANPNPPPTLTEVSPTAASPPLPSRTTGVSSSRGNQIAIPMAMAPLLEAFRMSATNLPVEKETVEKLRGELTAALRSLCQRSSPALVKALEAEVFAAPPCSSSSGMARTAGPREDPLALQEAQEIVPGLWCGSYHTATKLDTLRRLGITHVCCCIGTTPSFPSNFMYLTIAADDRADYDIAPHFARTFEFIENALVKSHGAVLVHCGAGISRAPTIVAAYLMRKLCISSTTAIQQVQRRRPVASPNIGFRHQLHLYGMKLKVKEEDAAFRGEVTNESFSQAIRSLNQQRDASKWNTK